MKPTTVIITAIIITASGCTPAQLDTFESVTGQTFDAQQRAALVALPDTPMRLDGTRAVMPSGAVESFRAGHCDQHRATFVAAGWDADTFDVWASRIVFRESRCNPNAFNRSGARGLMQIMPIVLADMRQRPWLWSDAIAALGGVPSLTDLFDPSVNAIVARNLYAIRGRQPWT